MLPFLFAATSMVEFLQTYKYIKSDFMICFQSHDSTKPNADPSEYNGDREFKLHPDGSHWHPSEHLHAEHPWSNQSTDAATDKTTETNGNEKTVYEQPWPATWATTATECCFDGPNAATNGTQPVWELSESTALLMQ